MLRRSFRLQDAGYYSEEGKPCISYKECPQRIFQRRKFYGHSDSTSYHLGGTGCEVHQDETIMVNNCTQTNRREVQRKRKDFRSSPWSFSGMSISIFTTMLCLWMTIGLLQQSQKLELLEKELKFVKDQVQSCNPAIDSVPNFGEETQGARVLSDFSSPSYVPVELRGPWGLFASLYRWRYNDKSLRKVIQGRSVFNPGDCWCFPGKQGQLLVKLSHPVAITQVTLAHISKSQDPRGLIASAPREFSIYGMRTPFDKGTYLGTRRYDDNGKPTQRFTVKNPDREVFRFLKLQIENNYGHKDFTCIYNLKVHGNLPIELHHN